MCMKHLAQCQHTASSQQILRLSLPHQSSREHCNTHSRLGNEEEFLKCYMDITCHCWSYSLFLCLSSLSLLPHLPSPFPSLSPSLPPSEKYSKKFGMVERTFEWVLHTISHWEPQFPHMKNGNHNLMLESQGCCKIRRDGMWWKAQLSSEYRHSHGGRVEVALKHSPYAREPFLPCYRKTVGPSHPGLQESKTVAVSLEKRILRTQDVRRSQWKFLPISSFRQKVKINLRFSMINT